MNFLQTLSQGIRKRDIAAEDAALVRKWEQTGLLEDTSGKLKENLARLLENQTKMLVETSQMARAGGGDVEGFASVAFPLVRRIFGGLIANDLVSVQPMSLPAGLIFFLDFKYSGDTTARLYAKANESIYGQGVLGQQITGGVNITSSAGELGFYHLNQGYSSPTGSAAVALETVLSGTYGGQVNGDTGGTFSEELMKLVKFDPEMVSGTSNVAVGRVAKSAFNVAGTAVLNDDNLVAIIASGSNNHALGGLGVWDTAADLHIRRFTQYSGSAEDHILFYAVSFDGAETPAALSGAMATPTFHFPIIDEFGNGGALGSIQGQDQWGLEADPGIPEIDINVDSIAVTAITKKLKARWTPELGQDLSAFHNTDAEVELTQVLSEQIALEIDREILEDLIVGAKAGTYYWSRSPGMFLNRETGLEIGANTKAPDFTGNVSEWNETLLHTIGDLSALMHRKTLRGGANFLVCGPELAQVMEQTHAFKASVTADVDRGTAGPKKEGSLSKRWDVWVDPYFPRNVILVGRRGSSFLESGYVYAPYVPLQVTPTVLNPDSFVPSKGVMTRYAKQMVRPDMYGLVIVRGLLGESGS